MTQVPKYELSFSVGALLSRAFEAVVNHCKDTSALSAGDCYINYDIIPVNSENSQKRYLSEIIKRTKGLPIEVLDAYRNSSSSDKRLIEFFAICRFYKIIYEFMIELVRKKWLNLDDELDIEETKLFVLNKLLSTDQQDQVSKNTLHKLAQVTLKMLKELGMYDGIKLKKLEPRYGILRVISKAEDPWFADVMLLTDNEKMNLQYGSYD